MRHPIAENYLGNSKACMTVTHATRKFLGNAVFGKQATACTTFAPLATPIIYLPMCHRWLPEIWSLTASIYASFMTVE